MSGSCERAPVCAGEIVGLIPKGQPYVYALFDPIAEEVFYIGKGRNKRLLMHEREARGPSGSPKCERIRAICAAGHQIRYQILSVHESDHEAYAEEARQIRARGGLTNGMLGRNDPAATVKYLVRRLKPWQVWLAEKERPAHRIAMAREIYNEILSLYYGYVLRPHDAVPFLGRTEFTNAETQGCPC